MSSIFHAFRFACIVAIMSIAGAVLAASAEDLGEAALRQTDEARVAAMVARDTTALGEILSDSLRYAHSTGVADDKESFIDLIASGRTKYLAYQPLERTISFPAPGIAIDAGRAKVTVENAEGQRVMTLSYLAIWREENGRWKFLAWQSARVPGAEPEPPRE